jgi:hypothetical protein
MGFDVGSEVDSSGLYAGFDIAGGVESFSGNNIPKFILDKEPSRGMDPIVEVIGVEFSEGKRWKFGKMDVVIGLHFW